MQHQVLTSGIIKVIACLQTVTKSSRKRRQLLQIKLVGHALCSSTALQHFTGVQHGAVRVLQCTAHTIIIICMMQHSAVRLSRVVHALGNSCVSTSCIAYMQCSCQRSADLGTRPAARSHCNPYPDRVEGERHGSDVARVSVLRVADRWVAQVPQHSLKEVCRGDAVRSEQHQPAANRVAAARECVGAGCLPRRAVAGLRVWRSIRPVAAGCRRPPA